MGDDTQYPVAAMYEKAQLLQGESAQLTDITHTHVQQMRQQHESMPASMQGAFGEFISITQQHLANGLELHQRIGILLNEAAKAAEGTDANIAREF